MNKVSWVIQTNLLNEDSTNAVWQAALDAGCSVHQAKVVPFIDELANEEELVGLIGDDTHIILPYGSCKLTRLAVQNNWKGCCYDEETFRTDVWNAQRDDMLNSDSVQMMVKEAEHFFSDKDRDDNWFIRPVHDLKHFSGTVTNGHEIVNWMKSTESGNFSFTEDTLISLSRVKHIKSEARFFVVDGKVVEGAYYMIGRRRFRTRIEQQETMDEAQRLAEKWLPHSCCVMDIAHTDDGPKVIEFNTLNSSGFYGHNIDAIVRHMTRWAQQLKPHHAVKNVCG